MAKRPNSPAISGFGGIWLSSRDGGGEMEGVEQLGKMERSVEDRVQTTTSANETRCARIINNSFKEHIVCFNLSLEPAAQS